MNPWLIPALKAVLPHVGTIISAAKPVFTKKASETAPEQGSLLQKQITELQAAAAQNAGHIKELAEQLQKTVAALEQGAAVAETRLQRVLLFCAASLAMSALALGVTVVVALSR
jgi:hypothetical protein